jgi:hypothetical protein
MERVGEVGDHLFSFFSRQISHGGEVVFGVDDQPIEHTQRQSFVGAQKRDSSSDPLPSEIDQIAASSCCESSVKCWFRADSAVTACNSACMPPSGIVASGWPALISILPELYQAQPPRTSDLHGTEIDRIPIQPIEQHLSPSVPM